MAGRMRTGWCLFLAFLGCSALVATATRSGKTMDLFGERIKELRKEAHAQSEHTRKLIESLDTIDDMELTELRLPSKRTLKAAAATGAYPPVYPSPSPSPSPTPSPSPSPEPTPSPSPEPTPSPSPEPSPSPSPSPEPKPSPSPSPSVADSTDVQTVAFTLTLQADFSNVIANQDSFIQGLQQSIATALGLQASQVKIKSVKAGSVVVDMEVLMSADTPPATIQAAAQKLASSAADLSLLDSAFATQFGVTGATVQLAQAADPSPSPSPTASPTPSPSPSPAPPTPPQDGGAGRASASVAKALIACLAAFLVSLVL